MSETIKLRRYLVIQENGSTAIYNKPPRLAANAIAVGLTIEIPKAIFKKPSLEAAITIPEKAGAPKSINATVVGNMADAIEQATGMRLAITVAPAPKDPAP